MHDQLSKIDELFRDASQQAEKLPADGDWNALKKKLFDGKSKRIKIILWCSLFVFISCTVVVASIYFYPTDVHQNALSVNKKLNYSTNFHTPQSYQSVQTQENLSASNVNYVQNIQYVSQSTNAFSKDTNTNNSNDNASCYKVQVGAFRNSPAENFYQPLGDIISEAKDGYHKYYAGVYNNPGDANNKLNEVKALGYADAFVSQDHNPVSGIANTVASGNENLNINLSSVKDNLTIAENIDKKNDSTQEVKPVQKDTTTAVRTDSIKPKKNVPFKKWGIGLNLSYDLNRYKLEENNSNGATMLDTSSNIFKGSDNFSYTLGLQLTYRFSEKLSAESGILFSQKKKLMVTDYHYGNSFDYTFAYNGKYIDVPVRLRYYFVNSPVKIYASAGMLFSSNFPEKNKGYFMLENPQDSGYYELVTMQPISTGLSMQLGAGVEYIIKNRFRIYFSPLYNHCFSPVLKHPTYDNEPINHFIRSLNIAAGCYYDF